MASSSKQVIFTEEEVATHDSLSSAWVISDGHVFNVTDFLRKHPGGADIILPHLGQHIDDELTDETNHVHSKAAYSLLATYKIGSIATSNNNEGKHSNGHAVVEETLNLSGWKENQVDWSKAMLPQVHRLGTDYKTWVHSPVDHKLKLFQSDFFEFFSKTPWYLIPAIWIPVTLYALLLSWRAFEKDMVSSTQPYTWAITAQLAAIVSVLFCCGILLWTLVEYVLHRFLFHLDPKGDSPFLITLHFFLHGQHHKVPFDSGRLVFPPVAAAFFASIFYFAVTYTLPPASALAAFAGGVCGYVIYDLTHYYLHHGTPARGSYLYRLKQYHIAHHFEDQARGFGISSKLWDYPFNTTFKKKTS